MKRYGPVPTGFLFSGLLEMSGYFSSRCFGRMCIPHDARAGAKGRSYSATKVCGSGAYARWTCLKSSPYAVGVFGSIIFR